MQLMNWPVAAGLLLTLSTGLKAQAPDDIHERVFPIVSLGPAGGGLHFQTTFSFTNLSNSTVEGYLRVFDSAGANVTSVFDPCPVLLPPEVREIPIVVPPGETVRRIPPVPEALVNGWALLGWQGPAQVTASAELSLIEAGFDRCAEPLPPEQRSSAEVETSTVTSADEWVHEVRFPVVRTRFRETAFSLVETSQGLIIGPFPPVRIQVLNTEGEVIREFTRPQGELTRQSLFISEIFELAPLQDQEPLPAEFRGSVRITSGLRFALAAVDIQFPGIQFVNVPVQAERPF